MSMHIKTNDPDFVRDDSSTALINTNVNAYKLYKLNRINKSQLTMHKEEITSLKNQINELTQLVNKLIEGKHDQSSS